MSWKTDSRIVESEVGVNYVQDVDVERATGRDVKVRSYIKVMAPINGKNYLVNTYDTLADAKADVKFWLVDRPNKPRDMVSFYTAAHFQDGSDEMNDGTGFNV